MLWTLFGKPGLEEAVTIPCVGKRDGVLWENIMGLVGIVMQMQSEAA